MIGILQQRMPDSIVIKNIFLANFNAAASVGVALQSSDQTAISSLKLRRQ